MDPGKRKASEDANPFTAAVRRTAAGAQREQSTEALTEAKVDDAEVAAVARIPFSALPPQPAAKPFAAFDERQGPPDAAMAVGARRTFDVFNQRADSPLRSRRRTEPAAAAPPRPAPRENEAAAGAAGATAPTALVSQFERLRDRFPQLSKTDRRMYSCQTVSSIFGSQQRFTPVFNDAGDGDEGPPLVVSTAQGPDLLTPTTSPRAHNTALREAVSEYVPPQDLMVNLGPDESPRADRQSTYSSFVHSFDRVSRRQALTATDRAQIRAQALLTNDYLLSQGGAVTPSQKDTEVDTRAKNLQDKAALRDLKEQKPKSKNPP